MKLTTTLPLFNEHINTLVLDGNNLFKNSNQNLIELIDLRISWTKKVYEYLSISLGGEKNELHLKFIASSQTDDTNIVNKTFEDLKLHIIKQLQCLLYINDMVSVADLIINPNNSELDKRKNFAISQKEEFILTKLYILYPKGKFYSIKEMFEYNAIPINSPDDDAKICAPMQQLGDIEIEHTENGIMAKLTEAGVKIVEKNYLHLAQDTNYHSPINSEKKFNSIIEDLNKNMDIQNIVFEEVNELRQLIHKLTPKIWKEVVIGKLVNLGLHNSAKNNTLKLIYEKLTDDKELFNG